MIKTNDFNADRAELLKEFIPADYREWWPYEFPNLKAMTVSERKAARKKIRKLADEDYFFFCEVIMRDPNNLHLQIGLHDEVCYITQYANDDLSLLPRNHLKTTLRSINYAIWCLCLDPNCRIVIFTDVLSLAKKMLNAIKSHIERNTRLRWIYPELRPLTTGRTDQKDNWNKEEITIRRTKVGLPEPSIMVGSTEQPLTGIHCDVMIFDDIVTSKNTKKENSLEKIDDWHQDVLNLLDMGGQRRYSGTRYNYGDQYSKLIKAGIVKTYRRRYFEDGKYIWPAEANIKRCLAKKAELSPYNFSCQYNNEPVMKGEAEFEESWVDDRRYGLTEVRRRLGLSDDVTDDQAWQKWYESLDIYLGCDPARTTNERSDYTVIMTVGFDEDGHMWGLKYLRKRLKTHEIIKNYLKWMTTWNPITAGVEVYGGDNHIYNMIELALKEDHRPTHRLIEYEVTSYSNNESRIRTLDNPMYEGKIHLPDDPEWDTVALEFYQFPYAEHDDCSVLIAHLWKQGRAKHKKVIRMPETGWRYRRQNAHSSKKWQVV